MLKDLWKHLTVRRKKQFVMLLMLMILASFTEMISIGAVLPFLGILTAPEEVFYHPFMQTVIKNFEELFGVVSVTEPSHLVLPLTIVFIIAALFSGAIRLMLLYLMTRFSYATGADLSIDIYRRTLYQDYSIHIARNSSEVINGIITKTNTVISSVLSPILTLISSVVFLVGIITVLFTVNLKVALAASIGFGLLYWGVIQYTRAQLKENSQTIAFQSTKMIKSIQEGLGGIRDVLIDSSQRFYCDLYRSADLPLRRATGNNIFISSSPRYIMEAIGMSLIAGLAYVMTTQQDIMSTAIPVLGLLALGAQRLLPVLQQAYGAYSSMKGAKSSFDDVLELLGQPVPDFVDCPKPIEFNKDIQLEHVSFCYAGADPWVLENITLKVNKGSRVGFVGATGSGKSTLLDIIMGLLRPTNGKITIDGQLVTDKNRRAWQAHIAHVPQNIYLSDSTIEENIAFGIPKENINHQQVVKAAKQAQIAELIDSWENGYQTFVGEYGVRLSGGQRQRIGIARALYKSANVLIFDEATSALDNDTEKEVMEAINALGRDLTILIIAHRLSTLKGCDQIVKIENNTLLIQ